MHDNIDGFILKWINNEIIDILPISLKTKLLIDGGKGNLDNMFVFCNECDNYMNYIIQEDDFGYWECPCCHNVILESDAYDAIATENNNFEKDFL